VKRISVQTLLRVAALLLAVGTTTASAQVPSLPPSSVSTAGDAGSLAHTYLQILDSSANFTATPQVTGPPFSGLFYQTPASIACVYGLQPAVAGCNPNVVSSNPSGGSKAVAVVDAYDYTTAFADLQYFSTQFGLTPITASTFQVVFAPHGTLPPGACTGPATKPPSAKGTGWDVEESLDIEWAHAMAPGATVYLVEAQSNSLLDLFCAVTVAGNIANAAGGGEVSMSWGSGEFSAETLGDAVFTKPMWSTLPQRAIVLVFRIPPPPLTWCPWAAPPSATTLQLEILSGRIRGKTREAAQANLNRGQVTRIGMWQPSWGLDGVLPIFHRMPIPIRECGSVTAHCSVSGLGSLLGVLAFPRPRGPVLSMRPALSPRLLKPN
jgi:hypothetical protein